MVIIPPLFINMIDITLYQFNKRPNSTKRPTSETIQIIYQCDILENCSIIEPVLVLRGASLSSYLGGYNYVYIPIFERYYYVKDVIYNAQDGYWHFYCVEDVLASMQLTIKASTQFVERSSLSYDGTLIDTMYPSKLEPVTEILANDEYFESLTDISTDKKLFLIGVINTATNYKFGSTTYYQLSLTELRNLVNYLLGDISQYANSSITGILPDLLGFIGDPLQFIVSCKYVPLLNFTTSLGTTVPIKVGFYNLPSEGTEGLTGTLVENSKINNMATVMLSSASLFWNLTDHPQASTRGVWLNSNTNTSRELCIFPWGKIPIDCSRLVGFKSIQGYTTTDLITGVSALWLYAHKNTTLTAFEDLPTDSILLGVYEANVCVDIPLNQYRHEGLGKWGLEMVSNLNGHILNSFSNMNNSAPNISNFQGGVSSGIFGIVQSAVGGAINQANEERNFFWTTYNAIQSFWGNSRTQGTQGCLLNRNKPTLFTTWFNLVDENNEDLGRPLCKKTQLSHTGLDYNIWGGYVKCIGATITSNRTSEENNQCERLLNSGVFLED